MKANYLVSCAIAAVLSGGAGAAVAAPSAAIATVTDTSTAAATDTVASAGSAAVGEVIVTAERRSESVQSVPMTVQAFTGDTLKQQNITSLDDLLRYTPNVTFGNNGPGQGNIYMRGLSAGLQGNQSSATIGNFPNVAVYLDDQSMQFPGRNVDIYSVDLQRVEVLEGPQGTLFGGGAEAGAIRYITNKPVINEFSGSAEAQGGVTVGGDPNYAFNAVVNLPVIRDRLAVRFVLYDDKHGGYIDNVPSTFTRSNNDAGNKYFNIAPNAAGLCPNGLPAGRPDPSYPLRCTVAGAPQGSNQLIARDNFNPVTYEGARVSALYDINDDWNVLISESFQSLDAEGMSQSYPLSSDFQPLGPLQISSFEPSWDRDSFTNTAWTVNGKIGPLRAIYTGSYMSRHIDQQQDYSNYARSVGGTYYTCTGGATGFGSGPPTCFSPLSAWRDTVRNSHLSNEFRLSTPDDWRIRGIAGVYQENFRIYDVMNFNYKTIPDCTAQNLAIANAGGQPCLANVVPAPGSTINDPSVRGSATAFGEDTQRGYDQLAFFGSVDFDIIPNVLTVSAGTRWYQYKDFELGSVYETGAECLNVPNGQCGPGSDINIDAHNDHATYSGFRSRANITWHVNQDVLAYFTYSEGFRPGGFNRLNNKKVIPDATGANQFLEPNSYAPDSLTNYEWGLKTELFDHRLLLDLSGYYMQWSDVQFLIFNPTLGINTTFGINGPNYEVKGVEAQFVARLTDHLTVQGSGSYNDDTQSSSPCLRDNVAGTAAFGQCITQTLLKGATTPTPFANPFGSVGSTAPFSPKFQGDIRVRYEWNVGDYKPFVQVGGAYQTSMFNEPSTYPSGAGVTVPGTTLLRYEIPGYGTMDASVGVSKDNWYAEIYGTNILDSHAATLISSEQFIKMEVPLRPTVIMLKVGAKL